MQLRISIPLSVLAATLTLSSLQPVHAADPPPRNPFLDPPREQDGPPGEGGGRGEGGPRGEGGFRGEGGPRGQGGPRGGGFRDNFSQREGETTEQYRLRLTTPYTDLVPDLTEDQKTHIIAILQAANIESQAIRADTSLSEERQRAAGQAVRADIPNRIKNALTDAQLGPYTDALNERAAAAADMQKIINEHPEEDIATSRERAIKGYEDFLDELSVKQKTEVIKILVAAQQDEDAVGEDTTKTAAQKTAALLQIHDSISAKVTPLLDADQRATWKKAHDAQRPR